MASPMVDGAVSVIGLAAIGCIIYGCWLIWVPAAWIVGGLLLLALANGINRAARERDKA